MCRIVWCPLTPLLYHPLRGACYRSFTGVDLLRHSAANALESAQYLATGVNELFHLRRISAFISDEAQRCLCTLSAQLLLVVLYLAYELSSEHLE